MRDLRAVEGHDEGRCLRLSHGIAQGEHGVPFVYAYLTLRDFELYEYFVTGNESGGMTVDPPPRHENHLRLIKECLLERMQHVVSPTKKRMAVWYSAPYYRAQLDRKYRTSVTPDPEGLLVSRLLRSQPNTPVKHIPHTLRYKMASTSFEMTFADGAYWGETLWIADIGLLS